MMGYYSHDGPLLKFSLYKKLLSMGNINIAQDLSDKDHLVDVIAYCIMPTHLHFVLCQLKDNGISIYMKNLLDSYTRYFNTRYKRKGPLWEGRFKSILVQTEEQLLHLTRYIHLNPISGALVNESHE